MTDTWKVPMLDAEQMADMKADGERMMRRYRRDMFAAAALTGIVASAWIDSPNLRLFVTEARELADLQIAELDRTEKQT